MDYILPLKEGDYAVFTDLYELYHLKVFRFFLKRVTLHDVAEDLTQQCFIRLWTFRHTLSENHSIEKQIFVMAHSLLVNHIEKVISEKKLQKKYLEVVALNPLNVDNSNFFEKKDQLHKAIATLPYIRKKVVLLKIQQGYTNKEIAQELSISVKTVENHITKAIHSLKQLLTVSAVIIWWHLQQ